MLKLGGSRRARLIAAFVAALSAFGIGSLVHLADGFGGFHEDRSRALPPIDADPRVQVIGFDSEFFERNPGPLSVEQVAKVAAALRDVRPAVVAFHLPIARNLGDPVLAAAVDGLNYVDLAEGEVFRVGGDWRFEPADGAPSPADRPSGVGIIPTRAAYFQTWVPLTFVTLNRPSWVPALSTAAVREFARVTGAADPTLAHGVDPAYRTQWPQPRVRFRWQDRDYAVPGEPSNDSLEVLSVDDIASRGSQLEGAIVFVADLTSNKNLPQEGPFKPRGSSYSEGAGPSGGYYTSVALQANVAAMLFAPPFHESNWPEVLGWSLGLALAVAVAVMFLRTGIAALVAFGITAVWWMLVVIRRFVDGGNFEFEVPVLVVGIAVLVAFALRSYLLRRDAQRLSGLAEYVPPAVVMALMGPKRRNAAPATPVVATVLYTDVRGYTTLAGQLDASRVKDALDVYYSVLGAVVSEHEGSLLYYAGDGMVVTFEDSEPTAHAERAVACGAAMQAARSRIAYALGKLDLPPLEFGVGIHTGQVIIGAIGSEHHRQFTALGEAVNIASRMCAVAEGGQVCLTEQTRELLAEPPPLVDLGELQLKNVMRGIRGWRISEVLSVA